MADEQMAQNVDDDNISSESPTEKTNLLEVEGTAAQSEKTEKSAEGTDTESKFTGAEKRIHSLVDKVKEKDSVIEDLTSKLAELQSNDVQQGGFPDYVPDTQSTERELTIDDLRTITRLEIEKEKTVNRINNEAAEAIRLHPELDKKSDVFDEDINNAVTSAVWNAIQRDPSQSVLGLTDFYMKPYIASAERAVGKEKANLAKQASDGALRPVSIKSTDRRPEDMSIAELEATLEMVY